jgi:hypothetical protein
MATLIGMHHHPIFGLPTPDSHQQRIHRPFAVNARTRSSADCLTRKYVQLNDQIEPAFASADVRDDQYQTGVGS